MMFKINYVSKFQYYIIIIDVIFLFTNIISKHLRIDKKSIPRKTSVNSALAKKKGIQVLLGFPLISY
jgi:hypothetical protein